MGVATGGLVIAFVVPPSLRSALASTAPSAPGTGGEPFAPNAFLRVNRDGTVQVLLAHSEMGQGIWTTLPMLIAEELGADWASIRVEHAPAAPEYAHVAFGMQATGGSTTTSTEFDRYRQAGAVARTLPIEAEARSLGVPASQCRAESGHVIAGERRVPFGELVEAASALPTPKNVALKAAKNWTLIGKPTKRLDSPEKITGRAQFGIDVRFDGLLTAMVARSPVFGGSVKSFDAAAAKAVSGVRHVVQVPSGVAVVADSTWAAKLGRDALKVDWDLGPNAALSSETMRKDYRALAVMGCGPSAKDREEAVAAFATVQEVLQHPRCVNCHIPGDAPLQFDAGLPHAQAVVRGPVGLGVPGMFCSTCHGQANPPASYGPHAPPGAPGWRLPVPGQEMVFLDATPGQLCETLKDPKKNGGRDFAALIHHVEADPLVAWGWAPGEGRAPVPIPRDEFVAQFKLWAEAGGPCPP